MGANPLTFRGQGVSLSCIQETPKPRRPMRIPYRPARKDTMAFATAQAARYAREAVERVRAYEADSNRVLREARHICATCWYFFHSRFGGNSMTYCHCGICGKEMVFGNTAVDKVCPECAAEHELCTQCGGDIKTRVRRRKWPEAAVDTRQFGKDGQIDG